MKHSHMDLGMLADFNLVASEGGFGQASRVSGRPKATLSRRVMALEESLGVRLFERGARRLKLTEEGRALYERTSALVSEILEVGQCLSEGSFQPRGKLRVSVPLLIGQAMLGELAAEFSRRYPEVELEVVAEDRYVDLVDEGYDVAVRVNPRTDATLVGRRIGGDALVVVAPPGMPRPRPARDGTPTEVPAVAMTHVADRGPWKVTDRLEIMPNVRITLSSLLMVRDAVCAGAGVALLPRAVVEGAAADGRLAIWSTVPHRTSEVWVLHASRRLVSTKVTAFVDFLVESFQRKHALGE
ncbi:MAG TPA: LysR substrate-binding domain-containing protein [Woeseiaceae bacterium]|nr:LysR substrate-binding domain-containing protein [Woeseiaceae bacterium]